MISKNEIKDIQSLTQKKVREELKLFVAEGPKIVSELMRILPGNIEKIESSAAAGVPALVKRLLAEAG